MKLKNVLKVVLSLSLVACLSIAGTIAYLQDTDEDVNVMTLGNVQIEQIEQEWNTDQTDLQQFHQAKPLLPYVGTLGWENKDTDNGAYRRFTMENVVDKYVSVKNTGKSDAYVRTFIALEMGDYTLEEFYRGPVGISTNAANGSEFQFEGSWIWTDDYLAEIDGYNYNIMVAVHQNPLKPGETTIPSLLQVYLSKDATNEDVEKLDGNNNGTYDILVFSEAVQADGFDNTEIALDAAFGDSHPWSNGVEIPTVIAVSNSTELAEAIKDNANVVINLEEGNYTTNLKIDGGKNVTINGTKDTVLSGQIATTSSTEGTLTLNGVTVKVDNTIADSTGISQTGKSAIAIWGNQTVICNNVTFDMSLADSTAITSWWDTGVGTTIECNNCTFNCNGQRPIRATGNVTVENCTFNDPYRYAVQLTAKASTATELDKAIINFNNNTIVNGVNGNAFVYGIQLEGADYGCSDLVINGAGNTIVNGGTDSTMYYCECGKVQHETIEWNVEVTPVHEN